MVSRREFSTLQLQHAETLLDVIFSVVVALPLVGLPDKALVVARHPSLGSACTLLLTVSSLMFCTFYWLEFRHFILEQGKFDAALLAHDITGRRLRRPLWLHVLSGLAAMAVFAAVLSFSSDETVRPYYVANITFWVLDLVGSLMLRPLYGQFKAALERLRAEHWHERGWYWGHIRTPYFLLYGFLNALFFVVLLLADVIAHSSPRVRLTAVLLVLALTLIRHGYVRDALYVKWLNRKYAPQVAA